jgi:two-component system cell cycle sensor histidine kinase PleC
MLSVSRTEDGGQRLSVKDTGPGIPEHEIPRVLQSFGQGSLAHETAEGGTGLGLPITRGLAELHDGKFELKSKLRYGTEVTITLPRSRIVEALPRLAEPGEPTARNEQMAGTNAETKPKGRGDRPWLWQQSEKRSA